MSDILTQFPSLQLIRDRNCFRNTRLRPSKGRTSWQRFLKYVLLLQEPHKTLVLGWDGYCVTFISLLIRNQIREVLALSAWSTGLLSEDILKQTDIIWIIFLKLFSRMLLLKETCCLCVIYSFPSLDHSSLTIYKGGRYHPYCFRWHIRLNVSGSHNSSYQSSCFLPVITMVPKLISELDGTLHTEAERIEMNINLSEKYWSFWTSGERNWRVFRTDNKRYFNSLQVRVHHPSKHKRKCFLPLCYQHR